MGSLRYALLPASSSPAPVHLFRGRLSHHNAAAPTPARCAGSPATATPFLLPPFPVAAASRTSPSCLCRRRIPSAHRTVSALRASPGAALRTAETYRTFPTNVLMQRETLQSTPSR